MDYTGEVPIKLLTVGVLTHNSEQFAKRCLESLTAQTNLGTLGTNWQIVCLDNASTHTAYIDDLERAFPAVTVLRSNCNTGFSAGHNRIMREFPAQFHAVLNIDCLFAPQFLCTLVEALKQNPHFGSATGKLLRWNIGGLPERTNIIDSCGIHMSFSHAFSDRGQGEQDYAFTPNAHDTPDVCFGGSGAATVYRRAALEHCKEHGQFFDEAIFMYKEDIDLAYRLLTKGHFCLFIPQAVAWHARSTALPRYKRSPQERILSAAHECYVLKKHRYQWTLLKTLCTNLRQFLKWTYLLLVEPRVFLGARKLLATLKAS